MLVKEYRILLPLTVEEYRIAQLYMIQKKSRLDSSGHGSGVEILTNKPYTDGPGGSGQYTYKIFHVGSKIPVWIRNVLPSTAFEAHEESWNAYPYTKTRYSCPLMDKFSVEVETKYIEGDGSLDNVFELSEDDLKNQVVDVMNFVKDPISSHDYCPEEDPKIFKSTKTGRGPLSDNWVQEHLRDGKPIMCAYKICRVEFRYWGLQTRAERWIHDLALKGTMYRAHRQAWAWQDEWFGLTMEDIRRLEEEVALYLSNVMSPTKTECEQTSRNKSGSWNGEKRRASERESEGTAGDSESEDQFYDCTDRPVSHKPSLIRWSSELLLNEGDEDHMHQILTPKPDPNSSLIILVFHGDIFPEAPADSNSKTTDVSTLSSILEHMIGTHYPQLKGRIQVLRVPCGKELASMMTVLKGLCPIFGQFHPSLALLLATTPQTFLEAVQGAIVHANLILNNFLKSETGQNFKGSEIFAVGDYIGGLLMYEAFSKQEHQPVGRNASANSANIPLRISENDKEENQANFYDYAEALSAELDSCNADYSDHSENSVNSVSGALLHKNYSRNLSAPPSAGYRTPVNNRLSTSSVEADSNYWMLTSKERISFRPSTAFLLGCPLAFVLMQRKMAGRDVHKLECDQLFNLYYSADSCAARLEPVLNSQLALLAALNVPRYERFPLGDGRQILFNALENNITDTPLLWGNRRVDQELFCPPDMLSLPATALPNIFHASYWENKDAAAFILRQFVRLDEPAFGNYSVSTANQIPTMDLQLPLGCWNRRRTRFKIVNLAANHRANDLIIVDDSNPVINARFCYGPMDLVALSQENVLVYVCPCGGEWTLHSKEVTDNHGRLSVKINKKLPIGINAVRMVVQGDHSYLNMYIAVVPLDTPCVVFSIDGSLTSSVSVSGRDPRIRAGAVDLVRFWQQQGYLIIYVTARPDMQHRLVASWLAQHNFPHGLLFFTPCLSTDPLKQKAQHLRHLVDLGIRIQATYGSSKDVHVYSSAGVKPEQIFKVGGSKRRGCIALEDGYAQHLHDLVSGRVSVAQPVDNPSLGISKNFFTNSSTPQHTRSFVQRTESFTPRSGKVKHTGIGDHRKKDSQLSISTVVTR